MSDLNIPVSQIPRTEMSDSMKKKLQKEYYNLGGSPGQVRLFSVCCFDILVNFKKIDQIPHCFIQGHGS